MNRNQRRVLMAVAIVVLAMLAYPPFYMSRYRSSTYNWIFGANDGRVNVELLFAQWAAVAIVGAIVYFLFADKNK